MFFINKWYIFLSVKFINTGVIMMSNRTVFLFIVGIIILCSTAAAQTLTIQYMEGYPFYRSDSEELDLNMGDELPLDGSVILEEGDYLELEKNGNVIRLFQPGDYHLQTIYRNRIQSPIQTSSYILNRLALKQNDIKHETTAGVRGDQQVTPDDFLGNFEDVDFEDYRLGMEYYEAGDFQTALRYFKDGMEWEGANYDTLYLHAILCLFQLNEVKDIQATLTDYTVPKDSDTYNEYMFFRVNWQIEQFQFLEALDLLDSFYDELKRDRDRQLADFLYGCCYYSLNDPVSAGTWFQKAETGPSENIAEQSAQISKSIKE